MFRQITLPPGTQFTTSTTPGGGGGGAAENNGTTRKTATPAGTRNTNLTNLQCVPFPPDMLGAFSFKSEPVSDFDNPILHWGNVTSVRLHVTPLILTLS